MKIRMFIELFRTDEFELSFGSRIEPELMSREEGNTLADAPVASVQIDVPLRVQEEAIAR